MTGVPRASSPSRDMSPTMPSGLLLVLEASSRAGSVALVDGQQVRGRVDVPMGVSRDDGLFPAVQQLLAEAGLTAASLAGLACGAGPGSFTSLRIAASLAKGLAHGAARPLYAVPSLLLAAAAYGQAGRYVVHGDALRGERFTLLVDVHADRSVTSRGVHERIAFEALDEYALAHGAHRLAVSGSPDATRDAAVVQPDAAAVVHAAGGSWWTPVALATWEPEYGRLAEAQVVWERTHGHALPVG
jgi:tRNA threonylcarbamoyladenosine biosynthesis protein TsaB